MVFYFKKRTSFLCFLVKGFPDFVSSGGGVGGAGPSRNAVAFSSFSSSGSRIEIRRLERLDS